jgi:filamentous hemagglutinin family protein
MRRRIAWIGGRVLVTGSAALAIVLGPARGEARGAVDRDGRIGSAGPGSVATEPDGASGLRFLIRESDGQRAGQNLFHSFSRFDLESNETAVYQGDPGIRNLVTTVTGGRSSIDGRITSEIPGANLFLINPDGVVFGENATVDLSGDFVVSSADRLGFSNGDSMETGGGAPPSILSVADPVRFGFVDAPASIRVEGSRIQLDEGGALRFLAGDLELLGGRTDGGTAHLSSRGGRVDLASLASAGEIEVEADGLNVRGDPRFGDITLADEIFVSSSGLGVDPMFDVREGNLPAPGSGPIFVRADDLLIRDADIRSLTGTNQAGGDIEIGLTGALTIEGGESGTQTGIFADSGIRIRPAPGQVFDRRTPENMPGLGRRDIDLCTDGSRCGVIYQATGRAGDVRIAARDVRLLNGGKITARGEATGAAGTIDIAFEDEMIVAGRRGPGDVSQISTNANGRGNPGTIRIRSDAGRLRLDDHGALVIQNGSVSLATGLPGEIEIDVARLEMAGNARIDSSTRGAGPGGRLSITARERMTLSGRTSPLEFTGISTLSQPLSTGPAGEIRITTPFLEMTDGAEIAARPADALALGESGSLFFDVRERLVMRDATISTASIGTGGGNIEMALGGVADLRDSSITTSAGGFTFGGGNITIRPGPDALVLERSQIIARAFAGTGGRIDLEAGVIVADAASTIDAEAQSEEGIDGEVLINGVEGNVVPEVAALATPAADASRLLREPCAARRPGASNRFVVDERRMLATDAGDYLAAPLAASLAAPVAAPLATPDPARRGGPDGAVAEPRHALAEDAASSDCTL